MLTALVILSAAPAAAEEGAPVERCVGWAIPGAVLGLALGYGVVAAGYAVAGQPIGESAGDVAIILAGESVGMTFGPVATCLLSDEPYTIPAASFAIGGGLVGGTAVAVPLMLLILERQGLIVPGAEAGDASFFADVFLFMGATVGGIIGGGFLGLLLERTIRSGPGDAEVMLLPTGSGAQLVVTF